MELRKTFFIFVETATYLMTPRSLVYHNIVKVQKNVLIFVETATYLITPRYLVVLFHLVYVRKLNASAKQFNLCTHPEVSRCAYIKFHVTQTLLNRLNYSRHSGQSWDLSVGRLVRLYDVDGPIDTTESYHARQNLLYWSHVDVLQSCQVHLPRCLQFIISYWLLMTLDRQSRSRPWWNRVERRKVDQTGRGCWMIYSYLSSLVI